MSGASAALVRLDLEVDLESLSPEALLEWAHQARTELTVHRRRISASRRSTLSHDVQGVAHGRRSSIDELEELQLLALRAETEGHWRTCSFARLPIQISGIALNICGIAALLRNVGILYPGLGRWVNHLVLPLYVESLLLQVLCFVRLGAVRPFWSDFKSLRHTSALGALLIAIQLAWAEMAVALATEEGDAGDFQGLGLSERGAQAAAAVSSGAAVVQTVVALYFLAQCVRRAAPVDCFWFPATVSLATPALTYPKLHQPQWVLYTTLSAGVLVAVLLWPPCLWRVLRSPREVAPNAAVFVLMAPVAFVTMGVFNAGGEALIGPDGMRALFALHLANVASVVAAAIQRRRALLASLCPLSPVWASLTFPLVSNCTVAVLFATAWAVDRGDGAATDGGRGGDGTGNATGGGGAGGGHDHVVVGGDGGWAEVASWWAAGMIPVTLLLVPITDVAWMLYTPNWFFCNPQKPADSVALPDTAADRVMAQLALSIRNDSVRGGGGGGSGGGGGGGGGSGGGGTGPSSSRLSRASRASAPLREAEEEEEVGGDGAADADGGVGLGAAAASCGNGGGGDGGEPSRGLTGGLRWFARNWLTSPALRACHQRDDEQRQSLTLHTDATTTGGAATATATTTSAGLRSSTRGLRGSAGDDGGGSSGQIETEPTV